MNDVEKVGMLPLSMATSQLLEKVGEELQPMLAKILAEVNMANLKPTGKYAKAIAELSYRMVKSQKFLRALDTSVAAVKRQEMIEPALVLWFILGWQAAEAALDEEVNRTGKV